jgi:hypothetical protein
MSEQPENDAVERLEPLAEPLEPPSEHAGVHTAQRALAGRLKA